MFKMITIRNFSAIALALSAVPPPESLDLEVDAPDDGNGGGNGSNNNGSTSPATESFAAAAARGVKQALGSLEPVAISRPDGHVPVLPDGTPNPEGLYFYSLPGGAPNGDDYPVAVAVNTGGGVEGIALGSLCPPVPAAQ